MHARLLNQYRRLRVLGKQALHVEPYVPLQATPKLEFHGNDYCGWNIPRDSLNSGSVVVDIGLGEDISFTLSVMEKYGCAAHGFDPTPRAIDYISRQAPSRFVMHPVGVAAKRGPADFYLPNEEAHVSGSLALAEHVGLKKLRVELISLGDVFEQVGCQRIDLLKLDIEGAEYDLLASDDFGRLASRIGIICVEFHHRWEIFGPGSTANAVKTLNKHGFRCAWRSPVSNEEFLFVHTS